MGCTASHNSGGSGSAFIAAAARRKRLLDDADIACCPAVAYRRTAPLPTRDHSSPLFRLRRWSSGEAELEKDSDLGHDVKICGLQTRGRRAAAAVLYETECRQFPYCNPKAAAAYARGAGDIHDSERLAVTALLVGLCEGLANVQVDPMTVNRRVDAKAWHALDSAIHHFMTCKAMVLDDGIFEPDEACLMLETLSEFSSVQARAEAFLQALRPLAEAFLLQLKILRRHIPKAAGPLVMTGHVVQRCSPASASAQNAAVAAFHVAQSAESELDFVAIHFLSAAWNKEHKGAVQYHHVGKNLGIMFKAVIFA
mmetsp:Transcript_29835/g.75056  ORF Transcript_29835/g.75056 Transcript_29835/m.75056 type:complete len:311 (+) Transcript_29835:88-1020(+)